eukprot:TRINITY_DN2716_c0_g1_i5.p1 TRINITY_DN2716_c0_g1~~TRINITY_DN2716_c0_g1_i5.p1  ORF type:complete len:226 (-),score=56.37 TRINITY_DN2716_c0_g1_i5:756-1433(-)
MAPASVPVEPLLPLRSFCGRLDIRLPPGLEHLAPSMPRGTASAAVAKKQLQANDNSPMYLDPLLLEPLFVNSDDLISIANTVDAALSCSKGKQDLSLLSAVSDCSTAVPESLPLSAAASWASAADAETMMSASTTGSAVVSPHSSESSSTMKTFFDHSNFGAVVFCGTYSVGSLLHAHGTCKPCDFSRRGGCREGIDCPFCHLCTEEDAKRKKKELKKAARQLRQ